MRLHSYWPAVALAGAMAIIQLIPALPASAAAPESHFGQAVQLRLPLNADKGASSELLAVDCVGIGWCLAGGGYSGPKYTSFAMTAAESDGHWERGRTVRLPTAALQAVVSSVHSTAVRSCVAVGNYLTLSGSVSFSVTETAGGWARPQIIAPPIGGGNPGLAAVSCFRAGSCEAVGRYQKGQDYQAITALESHGTWARERVLRLPSNGTVGNLNSVYRARDADSAWPSVITTSIPATSASWSRPNRTGNGSALTRSSYLRELRPCHRPRISAR